MNTSTLKTKAISYIALAIVMAIVINAHTLNNVASANVQLAETRSTQNTSKLPVAVNQQNSLTYVDGTYSAVGNYYAPDGSNKINVSITLKNDIIVATSATATANSGDSRKYQNRFISNYKTYVVGKPLNQLVISKVSGASLTTKGFNDALAMIKNEAKA